MGSNQDNKDVGNGILSVGFLQKAQIMHTGPEALHIEP